MTMWVDRLIKPSPTREAPGPREQLRNDIAVTVTVLFALFLALGIRNLINLQAGPAWDLGVVRELIEWRDNLSRQVPAAKD